MGHTPHLRSYQAMYTLESWRKLPKSLGSFQEQLIVPMALAYEGLALQPTPTPPSTLSQGTSISSLSIAQWAIFSSLLLALLTINLAIAGFTVRLPPEKHPRTLAAVLGFGLIAAAITIVELVIGIWYFDLVILLVGMSLTFMVLWSLTKRDKSAVKIAETTVKSLHSIDTQIAYILGELYADGDQKKINDACIRAVEYTLQEIVGALSVNDPLRMRTSLLEAQNGGFKVLGDHGIKNDHVVLIEQKLSYGNEVRGIAGLAASDRRHICINDLANDPGDDCQKWQQIETEEKKGSILCFPILRGASQDRELLAVLCISCEHPNVFNCSSIPQLLNYYAVKLAALVNCHHINRARGADLNEREDEPEYSEAAVN